MENNGLHGWFGRALKKLIVKVAQVVDNYTLGVLGLEAQANSIGSGDAEFWDKAATSEPTPSEEAVLTNWNNTKFAPYCAHLANRILQMENSVSAEDQIQTINDIKAQMCGVRNYFLMSETTGLQKVGIDTRTDLIDESFLLLQGKMDAVSDALGAGSIDSVIPNFEDVFANLIIPYYNVGPVPCEKQFLTSQDTAPVSVAEVIQLTHTEVPIANIPNAPTGDTQDKGSSTAVKAFFLAGLLLLIAWGLSDDDKKEKKSNNK